MRAWRLGAVGAAALGAVNPLLTLRPLVDAEPGKNGDCRQWLQGQKQNQPSGFSPHVLA